MNEQIIFNYKQGKKIRAIQCENEVRYYCVADVFDCAGFKAPTKRAQRFEYDYKKFPIKWTNGIRSGKPLTKCATLQAFRKLAEEKYLPAELLNFIELIDKKHICENYISNVIDENNFDINKMLYLAKELYAEAKKFENSQSRGL